MTFDVFLSYRRTHGADIARALKAALLQRGVTAFLDVDDLPSGRFDHALLRHIEQAPHFLVILTPNSLDACGYEEDWLRREITHAIATKRSIIPLWLDGVTFRYELPPDMKELKNYQAVQYSHEFFPAVIDKLVGLIAHKPTPTQPTFPVRQGRQITENDVRQASGIEQLVYDSEDFIAGPVVYAEWYRAYPDSFTLAFDPANNSVIGALIALPVTDDMYDRMAEGRTIDSRIAQGDIVPMDLPDQYSLYVADVMVHPEYQRWSSVLPRLIEHFVCFLTNRSREEVFVRRVLADVCSDYGTRLCKYVGMPLVRQSAHGSRIYEATMLPPSFTARCKCMKELLSRYKTYARECNLLLELSE